MSDSNSKKDQKTNTNGRPILVLSPKFMDAAKLGQSTSTYTSTLANATRVFAGSNFSWDVLNEKKNKTTKPIVTLNNVKNVKVYPPNLDTKRVFQGNRYTSVMKAEELTKKMTKATGVLGDASNAAEVILLLNAGDNKGAGKKLGNITGGKVGETVGIKIAGKVCPKLAKGVDIRKTAIIGASCYGLIYYQFYIKGDTAGGALTEELIKAVELIDKRDEKARAVHRQKELEKDLMLEWHPYGAD